MPRTLSVSNLMSKKFNTYKFTQPYSDVFGTPSTAGLWLIYGKEKNGKSWLSLLLSNYLSNYSKILYVSAEEGLEYEFVEAIKRAHIEPKNKNIHFIAFTPIEELYERLKKRNPPHVVVLDNLTIYNDLGREGIKRLLMDFPKTHFIAVAHEERNEPDGSAAKMASKLAKIKIRVKGLAGFVTGRCPGGVLAVDEEKAILYHGTELIKKPAK